ncbi:MAG: hypothetical protein IPL61_16085 [Myxococcales bacterium]|nr:hypothetical protein [Myxococcales bacterium]
MRVALLLSLVFTAVACQKSSSPAPAPGAGTGPLDAGVGGPAVILAKLESYRDTACACVEPACVQGVEREMRNWLLREGPALSLTPSTPAQQAAADKTMAAMETCVQKILHPTGQP